MTVQEVKDFLDKESEFAPFGPVFMVNSSVLSKIIAKAKAYTDTCESYRILIISMKKEIEALERELATLGHLSKPSDP